MKANDRDIGENAKSTYSIIAGDEKDLFEIVTDSQTQEGILTLKKVKNSLLFISFLQSLIIKKPKTISEHS